MLVLSRKVGERILIGDGIAITVVRIGQGGVRIGIEAPKEMPVVREELNSGSGRGDLLQSDAIAAASQLKLNLETESSAVINDSAEQVPTPESCVTNSDSAKSKPRILPR